MHQPAYKKFFRQKEPVYKYSLVLTIVQLQCAATYRPQNPFHRELINKHGAIRSLE